MDPFKEVTKEEFDEFISGYPNPLDINVTWICEPPMKSYNDFNLGDWPFSMVAKVQLWETYQEPNKYWILS